MDDIDVIPDSIGVLLPSDTLDVPKVIIPLPFNAVFGMLLKFIPDNVGVFVQLGEVGPDTSTFVLSVGGKNAVVFVAD